MSLKFYFVLLAASLEWNTELRKKTWIINWLIFFTVCARSVASISIPAISYILNKLLVELKITFLWKWMDKQEQIGQLHLSIQIYMKA